MALIVPIIGPTCAGKSTLLTAASQFTNEDRKNPFRLVEVGKELRRKYSPDYFQGQAAPKHTQEEAWAMCLERVQEHLKEDDSNIILIDGQPRDLTQLEKMIANPWPGHTLWYIHLYAPREVRRQRAWNGRRDSLENLELALARVDNDAAVYYELLTMMAYHNIMVSTYNTAHPAYSIDSALRSLVVFAGKE